jgi:glycosyltransferase involved in cell wall biosynthesis
LADRLTELQVALAHLHGGGSYGWGLRIPGASPFPYLKAKGIRAISTVHVVPRLTEGYCDARKALWLKLALLPLAWLGKASTLRHLDREIVISKEGTAQLRRRFWPWRKRFQCIYHSRLAGTASGAEITAREKVILCVGHIAERKGQHLVAEAFAQLAQQYPAWKLLIIGGIAEPAAGEKLHDIVRTNQLENRILLAGERNDAMSLMRTSAIFAQASYFEGLPLALQEAMALSCACVGTRISGNTELIDDEQNGLLVPAGDVAALVVALDRLMNNVETRHAFGAAAREAIVRKRMTAENMLADHFELYDSVLSGRCATATFSSA